MVQPRLLSADATLLSAFDADERCSAVFPGLQREELPDVVRHVDLLGHAGVVIYSRLSSATADAIIREQVDYFASLGKNFEWKAYAHDQPPDLVPRLAAVGFEIDAPEAVMVLDLDAAVRRGSAHQAGEHRTRSTSTALSVRRVMTGADLGDVAFVKERVYGRNSTDATVRQLAFELDNVPDYLSVYVAYVDDLPAASAWIRFPRNSAFASLWGGSTLPELRNHGLYSALLATRVDEARRRGYRYVTVDARATSRPILEKRGFQLLTYATACTWHG